MAEKKTIFVTVTLGTPTVSKAGFGTPLIVIAAEDTVFSDRVKSYASLEEGSADFASGTIGYEALRAAFEQPNPPTVVKVGREEAADANFTATLNAIKAEDNDWYFLTMTSRDGAAQQLAAAWAETENKFFAYAEDDKAVPVQTAIEALGYTRSFGGYHSTADGTTSDLFADIRFVARMATTTPGETTWSEKNVVGVTADTFTSAEITALEAVNSWYFIDTPGGTLPYEGKTASGEWADVIRFADWLKAEVEYNILLLKLTKSRQNSKVPYTSAGIAMYEAEIRKAFQQGITNGGLADYSVTMPKIGDVSTADKTARALRNIDAVGALAGAILYSYIDITLEA